MHAHAHTHRRCEKRSTLINFHIKLMDWLLGVVAGLLAGFLVLWKWSYMHKFPIRFVSHFAVGRVWKKNCMCRQCNVLHWSLAATLRSTSTIVLSMMIVNAAIDNHCFRNRTDSLFNGTAYNAWHHGKQSFSTWQPQSSQLNTLV